MPRLRCALRTFVSLLATLVAAALLAPVAAGAVGVREVPDDRRDYWHDQRPDGSPVQHAPDWGRPDILRTFYRHEDDEVRIRIRMARLDRGDGGYHEVEARFRTNTGLRRQLTAFKATQGRVVVEWSGPGRCRGIEFTVEYADDVYVLEVPRRCLGNPRRVAFKSATRWWPTSDDYPYLDVSGSPGHRLRTWSAPVGRN